MRVCSWKKPFTYHRNASLIDECTRKLTNEKKIVKHNFNISKIRTDKKCKKEETTDRQNIFTRYKGFGIENIEKNRKR
jgi:hypothetical protein